MLSAPKPEAAPAIRGRVTLAPALAASAMALCGVAAAVLVYVAMPETRGRALD